MSFRKKNCVVYIENGSWDGEEAGKSRRSAMMSGACFVVDSGEKGVDKGEKSRSTSARMKRGWRMSVGIGIKSMSEKTVTAR